MSAGDTDNPQSSPAPEGAAPEVTPERWQKIKELLLAVEEVDPADRDEFLRQACGTDEALRAEIDSLLAADQNGVESDLSTTRLMQTPGLSAAAVDVMVGRRVGAYEIVRPIGH